MITCRFSTSDSIAGATSTKNTDMKRVSRGRCKTTDIS